MNIARRVILVATVLGLVAPAGWAQEKSPKPYATPNMILLARTWDEAIYEATIRNVPILFTTAMAT